MWKIFVIFTFCLIPVFSTMIPIASQSIYQEELSPYAKWGRVAMQATKEKYPNAAIVDYLHVGAVSANGTTTEKFKLWLRETDKEFGVYIDIRFNTDTEEIIEVTFEETDS